MDRLGVTIGVFALIIILIGVLIAIDKTRRIGVPEGFANEYESDPTLNDIANPITKTLKKIGHMSLFFVNPLVWKDAIENSNLSLTDLARKQIRLDKEAAAAAAAVEEKADKNNS